MGRDGTKILFPEKAGFFPRKYLFCLTMGNEASTLDRVGFRGVLWFRRTLQDDIYLYTRYEIYRPSWNYSFLRTPLSKPFLINDEKKKYEKRCGQGKI